MKLTDNKTQLNFFFNLNVIQFILYHFSQHEDLECIHDLNQYSLQSKEINHIYHVMTGGVDFT